TTIHSSSAAGQNATIKALQDALQEKEKHLEQLMRERDMERSEMGHLASQDQSEKVARLESERKALRSELLAKDKIIEDLNFRMEEEIISKDYQIQELRKKLIPASASSYLIEDSAATASGESLGDSCSDKQIEDDRKRSGFESKYAELEREPKNSNRQNDKLSNSNSNLMAEIHALKAQLTSVESDRDKFKHMLDSEKVTNENNCQLLESLRDELASTKEQTANDRFIIEEQLTTVKDKLEEKTKLLDAAESSLTTAQKELQNVRGELRSALSEVENQKKTITSLSVAESSTEKALNMRVDELEEQLQDKNKTLEAMEHDKKSLEETVRTSMEELQQLKNALGTLEEDRSTIQEAFNSLKKERLLLEQQLAEQRTENENRLAELTERIAAVNAVKESIEAELSHARAENEEFLREKSAITIQHTEFKDNADRVSKETAERCTHLEARIKELESQLNEERLALSRKEEELATVLNEMRMADAEYKAKLDAVTADHAKIVETLSSSLKAAKSKCQEYIKESAVFKAKLADLENAFVEEREKQVAQLTKNFQQITEEYDKLVRSKTEVDEQLRQQKTAFIALQNTVDASKLGEGAETLATDLAAAHEISSERLAEANKLQTLVKSTVDESGLPVDQETLISLKKRSYYHHKSKRKVSKKGFKLLIRHLLNSPAGLLLQKIISERLKKQETSPSWRLAAKFAEIEAVADHLRSELEEKVMELENVCKDREDAFAAKHKAESQVSALTSQVQELEQTLVVSTQAVYLKSLTSIQNKDDDALQLVEKNLAKASIENTEYLNEKERLLADIEDLGKKLAGEREAFKALQVQLSASRAHADQLSTEGSLHREYEDELTRSELANDANASSEISQQMRDEFADAMEKVRTTTKLKNSLEEEMAQLKNEVVELQREVTSLRLNEANANLLVSEAKQKIDLYNELELDWQKKQLSMSEKIEELSEELEQAKARTQSEEVDALRKELAFTHSIIADQRRKEAALLEKIAALNSLPAEAITADAHRLSFGHREEKPRMYCDICEEFDQHETEELSEELEQAKARTQSEEVDALRKEDCPKQVSEEEAQPVTKKTPPPPREYCDYCEDREYGLILLGMFPAS
ncbi:hypothetical protein ANCCEY_14163, partial [Ancylostoma ceylanicum]